MVFGWELRYGCLTRHPTIPRKIHHRECIETGARYRPLPLPLPLHLHLLLPLLLSPHLHTLMRKSSQMGGLFPGLAVLLLLA